MFEKTGMGREQKGGYVCWRQWVGSVPAATAQPDLQLSSRWKSVLARVRTGRTKKDNTSARRRWHFPAPD